MLGQLKSLNEGLAEKGEGAGGLGFNVALGDGSEEAAQGEGKVSGGNIVTGKKKGDVLAGFLASKGLRLFAGVESAEMRMAVAARSAAAAAICERERTQGRAVLGAVCGHRNLQKVSFGIFEGVSRKRGALLYREECTRVALRCQYNSLIILSSDSNDRGFECDRSKGRASSTRTAKRAPLYRRGKKGARPRLFILCGRGRRCRRGTCRRG